LYKIFHNTLFIGKQVLYLSKCHSTNDVVAKLLGEQHPYEGALVITDHQTAGKGQRGNSWEAEPGLNLTFSFLLCPRFLSLDQQFMLNIVVALGIHDFLSAFIQQGLKIKWPNDLYVQDRKIGGILIENVIKQYVIESSVVGIGINVNQKQYQYTAATSLALECDYHFELTNLMDRLLPSIECRYLQLKTGKKKSLIEDYLKNLYWMGEERIFKGSDLFKGEITGIDPSGKLCVKVNGQTRAFDIKQIQFVE
jgi:BirA family transcriptional regulator, biotin operon repressor / biotin---[acetyl-CoA-carboxylase] ligase